MEKKLEPRDDKDAIIKQQSAYMILMTEIINQYNKDNIELKLRANKFDDLLTLFNAQSLIFFIIIIIVFLLINILI